MRLFSHFGGSPSGRVRPDSLPAGNLALCYAAAQCLRPVGVDPWPTPETRSVLDDSFDR
jgi:hypothetical protein